LRVWARGEEKLSKIVRINKYLTEANYCSRRQADRLVEEGRVRINAEKARLGGRVQSGDKVFVDGSEIKRKEKKIYIAYNKPVGVICTTDKTAKDNIIGKIKYPARIYPIGRLDVNTSGLILLTNDGNIVNRILKGRHRVEKEYEVSTDKKITEKLLSGLEQGVVLDGLKTLPIKLKQLSERKLSMVLTEGKNRQVRRMVREFGFEAVKLKRVRIGQLKLEDLSLRANQYIELKKDLIDKLILLNRP